MIDYISGEEEEYKIKYGNIPFTQEEILEYLRNNYKINLDKIEEEINNIQSIPWDEVRIILYVVPSPSPRPRYSFETKHFYVKGAAKNKGLIKKVINKSNIIYTRTIMETKTYQPTPLSSMTNHEIYLAELGVIRPTQNPDYDNLAKTYTDMIQGILLLNDNIVSTGTVDKYFSIKPRVEITIKYQLNFDSKFNRRRVLASKSFKSTKDIVLYTELL